MNRHTPGPWRLLKGNQGALVFYGVEGVANMTPAYVIAESDAEATMQSNAALIAAAPELLEVAKELLEAIDTHFGIDSSIAPKPGILRWRVVAAIAKAEGGAA